jgi:ribbon-helix-helix CopG family protein
MKTVSLKLADALLRKLERAARARGESKSEVIRSALEQYLDGEPTIPPGSALEAARPWIGCVEGPGDLATNPKYLEGFGE